MKNIPKILTIIYLLVSIIAFIIAIVFKNKVSLITLSLAISPWNYLFYFIPITNFPPYFTLGLYLIFIILNGIIINIISSSIVSYYSIKKIITPSDLPIIQETNPLKSKIGLWFVGIYFIISAIIGVYSFTCHDSLCGIVRILPTLPTFFVFGKHSFLDIHYIEGYIGIILINSIFVYILGMIIQIIFNKIRSKI
jgi:hypothetical protein